VSSIIIRQLRADDFPGADVIRRLAFGTFVGLADPLLFRGDQDPGRTRFLADPHGSFAAELNGELVGINFAVNWGSLGLVGPVAVHPDVQNQGVAQRLMEAVLDTFARRGTTHIGLFTMPASPKHVALYQKFGFWPRFLTYIMGRPVRPDVAAPPWEAFSSLSAVGQQACLEQCRGLTNAIYAGLDLSHEIEATHAHGFGETIVLRDGEQLDGFAICHYGPGTEGGTGTCYVKFGTVRAGAGVEQRMSGLLAACDRLAAGHGLAQLSAGTNTARRDVYRQLLSQGFRVTVTGLAMNRPDEDAYNRPGVYVIDDWR
jgi:GNAT superfamily N-acetyltransferase